MKKILLGIGLCIGLLACNNNTVEKITSETKVEKIVSQMSEKEKLGQLIMPDFRNWNDKPLIKMNDDIKNIIEEYKFGGIILFRENIINKEQATIFVNQLQEASDLPLLIATDQEGGYVTRLQDGTELPGNMALGASRSVELAKDAGTVIGSELNAIGINMNFGPVVDVNSNQKNPIIGVRSFGDRSELVGNMANAYVDGLHSQNVMTTLKHFPGHGNTESDSHIGLATVNYSKNQWEQIDKIPFEMAIANDADAIMTAHVIFPSLDNTKIKSKKDGAMIGLPATLSKPIMTGVLRNEMNFKGLIITDALDMHAISENFGRTEAVIESILAGADVALMPVKILKEADIEKIEKMYNFILKEAKTNKELRDRITESAERVISLKLKKNLIGKKQIRLVKKAKLIVGNEKNKLKEKEIAEKAITVIKNDNILPFDISGNKNILILSTTNARAKMIKDEIETLNNQVKTIIEKVDYNKDMTAKVKEMIKKTDFIIMTTYNLKNNTKANEIVKFANENNKKLVTISTRNPYDIAYLPSVKANIAIYGVTGFDRTGGGRNALEGNIKAGVRTIFTGKDKSKFNVPTAKLPVDIKDEYGKIIYKFGYGLTY
ncbi:MAG: hypothetical protein B6I28_04795 [Fusobacteriia bacterium 4572_132]|nr:MAG: hypothetical protein B6I28_04795 [Fusobacteriia bacterium 4572_132]